jgi:hypothetical protein
VFDKAFFLDRKVEPALFSGQGEETARHFPLFIPLEKMRISGFSPGIVENFALAPEFQEI